MATMCAMEQSAGVGHIAYRIPDDLHSRAKALAAYKGVTFKAWLEEVIAAEVERQERERDKTRRR